MSARELLAAAVAARLREAGGIAAFDAPPARAVVPYAVVEEADLSAWAASALSAREGRITVSIHDAGERPVRLRELAAAAEAALAGMPAMLGEGWKLTRFRLARGRAARAGGGDRWRWAGEFEVRMFRAEG